MKTSTIKRLAAAAAAREPIVLAKRLSDAAEYILPDAAAPAALQEAANNALKGGKTITLTIDGEEWFIEPCLPAPRLIIVGAVHIAEALCPFAALHGFETTIVDPRRAFASAERFPNITLDHDWPDLAMARLKPDARTAVVTLTHDPKLDDPALDTALRGDAFFIGSLGSRKTHSARLERLTTLGHDAASLARIRGPVGLNIGAVSTSEIALSIMAEIIAVYRGAPLGQRS